MAYADVTSLYHGVNHLLNSPLTSVASSTIKILKSARRAAKRLQRTLERYDAIKNSSEGVMVVEARISEEACKLEDAIESQASAQFLLQSHSHGRFSLNLDHLRHDIRCFVETAKKMRAEYMEELYKKPSPHEEAVAAAVLSTTENNCDMVGFSGSFLTTRDFLMRDETDRFYTLQVTGMAGIGKTTLVEKVFHDSLIKEKFKCRAFVKVGQKYEFEQVLRAIISQLNAVDSDDRMINEQGDENISEYFKTILTGRKFLIVLDDVWDKNFDRHFTGLLPENCDGSFFLVTSRIERTFTVVSHRRYTYSMHFLTEEESWELLQRKVFGEGGQCPPQLVKSGKRIAENCEGLPLLIVTIAQLLCKAPKNQEYWKDVADMRNSVFEDACDQIYERLLRSYHHMAQNSKACFLYMGIFPKGCVFRRSRIINLWHAERFAEGVCSDIFDNIVYSNLVVIRQKALRTYCKVKACNLHVVYRHLCRREGENNKFLHILNRYAAMERIKGKRRLAIYHSTSLAVKEIQNSIASASTLRSVLCTGTYHQYQVPIHFELKLLRVLDAVSIRFYEFPIEVVELIQLRYLSMTTNADLPPSIHKLCFLRYLIVHQHLSIIDLSSMAELRYVPVEIWHLQELEHLQIVGRNLPHPPPAVILPNLAKLLDVGIRSCAKRVLERMPKLEKLRVQIESGPDPDAAAQTMICFDNISSLEKLGTFQSVVINPSFLPKPTVRPWLLSIPSSSLGKLSLSGFGFPWEYMSRIAEMPCLQTLKLLCFAFRGEKWDANEMRFKSLRYLLIEDTDLTHWNAADETFTRLLHLTLKNCHKLREIPQLKTLYYIKLHDCNPLVETWAKAKQNVKCEVEVQCSWK